MPPMPAAGLCLLVLTLAGARSGAAPAKAKNDPVILAFAVTGDCRLNPLRPVRLSPRFLPRELFAEFGKADGPADPYPFYFNIVQVRQTLRDVAAIRNPAPAYLFLTGDQVMGFAREDHGAALTTQLEDFAKALRLPEAKPGARGPRLVILPGNHEMTFNQYVEGHTLTGVDDDDNQAWKDWVRKHRFDTLGGNGPGLNALSGLLGNTPIQLKDDQSRMTYSFNHGPVHFVVINTDTATTEMTEEGFATEGLLPLAWIQEDLRRAQADPAIRHIFLVGHKPVRPPANFQHPGPYDALHPAVAEPFRQLLLTHSKVRAYLVSHAHLFHAGTLADRGDAGTRPVQIVAGNGGADFEKFWRPETEPGASWLPGESPGPFFGFTLLKVHRSGKVTYNSWQRQPPVPPYGAYPDPALAPARPRRQSVAIR